MRSVSIVDINTQKIQIRPIYHFLYLYEDKNKIHFVQQIACLNKNVLIRCQIVFHNQKSVLSKKHE